MTQTLPPDLGTDRLLTQPDCPYHTRTGGDAFALVLSDSNVTGFRFLGELYSLQM